MKNLLIFPDFGRRMALWLMMVLVLCVFGANAARAEFAVCNQSFDVVNVAVGQFEEGEFGTQGWWTVGPNQCANVIRDPLEARYIYVFAQDVFGKAILNGTTPMCIGVDKFSIHGVTDCLLRGYLEAGFFEVDTQKTERWTLFLSAPQN
ncbi:MAG: putative membrane protein [Halocynthiibacter sp.]|jgi:uncharacterized membrane protein